MKIVGSRSKKYPGFDKITVYGMVTGHAIENCAFQHGEIIDHDGSAIYLIDRHISKITLLDEIPKNFSIFELLLKREISKEKNIFELEITYYEI